MKKVIVLIVLNSLFLMMGIAQSDTTYISQVNDTIYQQVMIEFDDQGREILRQNTYYDSAGFYGFIFDLTFAADKAYTLAEAQLITAEKRDNKKRKGFKEMKDFFSSFINRSYVHDLDSLLKSQLQGDWRLFVNGVKYDVVLTPNQKKIKDVDSDKKMKITYTQVSKLEIKQTADDSFFAEDVILLKSKDNQGRRCYKARTDGGIWVVLRR